ncbi:HNH endonuclease family protein [Brevibacterium aurantiacum]|uniref:HNH endonuclease family protein n=1 Tax=Brevibacterium aurantiacum TaxID=273384 RepID=UPI0016426983|nr:HNH endonuclease family protein [Brevibacterium aurantiacum]
MSNSMNSAVATRSARIRAMSLLAVSVLALLSGCGGSGSSQVNGSEVAWSTGGGGTADSDPVPSRPSASAAPAQGIRPHNDQEVPANSGPDVSAQTESKPAADGEDGSGSPQDSAGTAGLSPARSMLDELEVKVKERRTGYDPELFDWTADVDDNGCDTRNDALRRDLKDLKIEAETSGCVAIAGDLDDKYLGESYAFERGSANVDVDYIVSGSNAWQTGASGMSVDELREFGNDPLNLLTVSANVIRQKGGGDAAAWLPPNEDFQCEYVSRQIAIKHKYGLWVASAEKDAMEAVLDTCADQPAFNKEVAWPEPGEGESVSAESAAEETPEESSEANSTESSTSPTGDNTNPNDGDSDSTDGRADGSTDETETASPEE